jgi:uncharacterized protein YbaA (DUF1428 family)
MTYVEGFVCAVPTENKDAYRKHAADAAPLFREFGVTRMVENWGDDVPRGKLTDFYRAVQAEEGETVVFSWFEYPDKATRDAASEKMMSDPRMKDMMGQEMPFDGKRMIYGGFQSIVDESADGATGYVDGYLLPVPEGKKDAYLAMARKAAGKFKSYGAVRVVEAWSDDVPEGKVTDYQRAVKVEDGEGIIYSYVEWPDKETRDAGWQTMMSDPDMQPDGEMPFDGKRMFWGGFRPIIDTAA